MTAREDLATALRTWRERAGLSRQAAAEALRVDPSQVSRWENGKQLPKQNRAVDFADIYGVDRCEVREKIGVASEEDLAEAGKALAMVSRLSRRVEMIQTALDEIVRRLPSY
jgi:transcriptional regulator with XRE-family HTH domain